MTTEPFTLTPSPADPQPVKVFRLDDYEWWAGYSLQQCIDAAHAEDGEDVMEYETESRELTPHEMDTLCLFYEDGSRRCFKFELDRRIAAGEQFPQLFASTEY